MAKHPNTGRAFEQAVFAFVKALDPSAEVIFNHRVFDRESQSFRQCDVWINAKVAGYWPISILVSCKDKKVKLDAGHIGTFINEIHSTGASTGVIYSHAGFFEPALTKAKANGIACCRLYMNEPADLPASIIVFGQFLCNSCMLLEFGEHASNVAWKTWGDLFHTVIENSPPRTLLDVICEGFIEDERNAANEVFDAPSFPSGWGRELRYHNPMTQQSFVIRIHGAWQCYQARLEAFLLNGSYCLSNGAFIGEQSGPTIDLLNRHPGEDWEEITDPNFKLPDNAIIFRSANSDFRQALLKHKAHRPLAAFADVTKPAPE